MNEEIIEIPLDTTEIKAEEFANNDKLKELKLSEKLKKIGRSAFKECKSLETIKIPASVTEIGEQAFYHCNKLKRIKLPNDIATIPPECFAECEDLEQIILPDSLKTIDKESFHNCEKLKNIVIPNGVEHIATKAFSGCKSLKKIIIPSSVTKIGFQNFGGYTLAGRDEEYIHYKESNIETIIINYDSYPKLKDLIENNEEFFKDILDQKDYPKMHLYFAGPKLSFFQNRKLQRFFEKTNITFLAGPVSNESPKDFEEKIETSNLEEDIQKIINEINELSNKLSNESKKVINGKINELLNEYEKNKQKLKPQYGKTQTILSMDNNISMLKPQLISNLEMIKLSLASEEKLIQFLSDLDNYKKILDKNPNELSKENDSIESTISNIIYYCNFINSSKKQEVLNKLKAYINTAIETTNNELVNINNQEIVLNTNDKPDTKTQLKLNISKLYDEVEKYASKVKPYQELLSTLNTKENVEKEKFGTSILEIISGIRYVMTHLSDSKYQEELEEKFANITHKYSSIIEKEFENPEELSQLKYEKLEKNLREELQPLLELMNKYAYLDSYETDKANNINLLSQLYSCLDIVEGQEIVAMKKEQKLEPLTSTIIDLNNDILSNDAIEDSVKKTILQELSEIINQSINTLQNKVVNSLDEYNTVQSEILGRFMEVKIKIDQYIRDLDEYNKHTR